MINTEDKRWNGFKEVIVTKIVQEDELVKSFYLENPDKSELPDYIAGQFVAIKMKEEDGSFTVTRQYTLSTDYKKDYYRVSIKREADGFLSKKLCDEVKEGDTLYITAPIGKFVLKDSEKPLVLISGGIGITPMLTMAYAARDTKRKIDLVYSTRNSHNNALEEEVRKLQEENENIRVTIIYTRPTEDDKKAHKYHKEGRIDLEYMKNNFPSDGEFYFCGPFSFMKALYRNLIEMGISKENIKYELFGATSEKIDD